MTQYLQERLCNGHAPKRIDVTGNYLRETLVSRMMMDRRSIRVLSAPSLMGKTTLAYSYAKIVFSFENVLWLATSHPCVLRDLDNGTIGAKLRQVLDPQSLVVFEDVPWFGDVRRRAFASVCEGLLEYGCEVLVTCVPACDPFEEGYRNRLLFTSSDLLFSDAELEDMRSKGFVEYRTFNPKYPLERVPGVNNDRKGDAIERFLHDQLEQARSPFERAITVAVVLLESADVDEVSDVVGAEVSVTDLRVFDLRPYVALKGFGSRFCASGFPVNDVVRALRPFAGEICRNLPDGDLDAFLCRIADVLGEHRCFERAAKLLVAACGPQARARWLSRNQAAFLEAGCAFWTFLLFRSLRADPSCRLPPLQLGYGISQCQLGNRSAGVDRLLAVARRKDARPRERLLAATVAALYSSTPPSHLLLGDSFGDMCSRMRGMAGVEAPLACLWNALLEGDAGLCALAQCAPESDCTHEWLLAAACSLHAVRLADEGDLDENEVQALPAFSGRLARAVERSLSAEILETSAAIASRELESCDGAGTERSRQCSLNLGKVEARLQTQRSAYMRLCEGQWAPVRQDPRAWGSDRRTSAQPSSAMTSVPVLEVNLFGGFEVLIGGIGVDPGSFARLKVRALLALLVLNAGKDVSCERLAAILWPDSLPHKAKRNFYSIFSMLRKALMTSDGDCPYLAKSQCICRLDVMHLRSDVVVLSDLCTRMRFGSFAAGESLELLDAVRGAYRGELLPGECSVPAVEAARAQWRSRVVDALLDMSRCLQAKGEIPVALEYAKQAAEYDNHREDCYELLMTLQMTSSQRTAAVETFFRYQKKNAELGLGVSNRIFELYNCVVNDEPLPRFALEAESAFA